MSASAYVDRAATMAEAMVRRETRGPGDTENAMRRLATRYGIPHGTFWSLKYRRPKDMLVSVFAKLSEAYDAECIRQQRLLDHERSIAAAAGRPVGLVARASLGVVPAPVDEDAAQ